jgi:hypothetical protein
MKVGLVSVWWCLICLTPLHHGQGQKNIDNGDNIPTTNNVSGYTSWYIHTPNYPTNKGFKKENFKNQKGSSTVHSNSKEEEDGILRMCCDGQKYSQ